MLLATRDDLIEAMRAAHVALRLQQSGEIQAMHRVVGRVVAGSRDFKRSAHALCLLDTDVSSILTIRQLVKTFFAVRQQRTFSLPQLLFA
jgi:hypothetical protein